MSDSNPPTAIPVKEFSSAAYWKRRYARGGNAGSGSYGRLARYKAGYINDLVAREGITSAIEFGSGDGNQASLFAFEHYTGVDVSREVIDTCSDRFSDHRNWSFVVAHGRAQPKRDMAMSLDVIHHLVEDSVFDVYMRNLLDSAERYVLIYPSDHDATTSDAHVRHRNFSAWIKRNPGSWTLLEAPVHPFPLEKGPEAIRTNFVSFKLFKASSANQDSMMQSDEANC